jgi:hypothetical protein
MIGVVATEEEKGQNNGPEKLGWRFLSFDEGLSAPADLCVGLRLYHSR